MEVNAIIPFYNEEGTIQEVARAVLSSKGLQKVIFVDDGSTDSGFQKLKNEFPKATIIKQEPNKGKFEAIKLGASEIKSDTVLLIDADYKNLDTEEINRVIDTFEANNLDLLLVKIKGGNNWFDRQLQKEILLTGFRILKKSDLESVLSSSAKGYQLEVAINKYMLENGKKIAWIDGTARNTHKANKWGFVKGLTKSVRMEISILKYIGFPGFLKQMLTIPKNKI